MIDVFEITELSPADTERVMLLITLGAGEIVSTDYSSPRFLVQNYKVNGREYILHQCENFYFILEKVNVSVQ